MPDYDTDAARAALEAAFDGGSEQAGEQPTPDVTSEVEPQERATTQDTFTSVDPATLAPELQEIYKQMQGDYTRKTQAVAERARELSAFGSAEEVRNAVEFAQALRDPSNLVQLHSELSEYLQDQGLTPAQADAVAAQEVQRQQGEQEWGFSDPDDDIRRELEALKSQNQELQSWRQQEEEQRQLAFIEQDIARKESFIRQQNPSYKQDDIDSIYVMSYAFGGDLIQAAQAYEDQRRRFASEYIASKGNVPASLGPVTPDSGAQAPEGFGRDLNAAHDYAKRRAAAELGGFGR